MPSDRSHRVESIFAAARARPEADRAAYLAEACREDAELRVEVESLLAEALSNNSILRPPAVVPLGAPTPRALVGTTLGAYRIVSLLGVGGMGEVYRAVDTRLHRDVAIKVLPTELVADPDRRHRFLLEARTASGLEHPNIAVIHEVGEADGISFIAMELIRGEQLSDVLKRGPLATSRAIELAIEVAEGLARAHEKGVVHRDLKPANVMITEDGHAKIIDFGLAKIIDAVLGDADDITRVTRSGEVLGTPHYMSPEQARGQRVDHRSDIFSFGTLLYEMLAGRLPFARNTTLDTLHAIMHESSPPLPSFGPSVRADAASELQRVIDKCLTKDPHDRYQGTRDLVVDLRLVRQRLQSDGASRPADAQAVAVSYASHSDLAGAVAPNAAPPDDTVAPRGTRVGLTRRTWFYGAGATVAVVAVGGVAAKLTGLFSTGTAGRTLAVILIENLTGDASLDWMDRGLCELLTAALSQSNTLAVLSTERVRSAAAHRFTGSPKLTADQAHDVAADARADVFASGTLFKLGSGFRLNLRAQETASGRLLYAGTMEGQDPQALFGMADRAVTEMLAQVAPKARVTVDSAGGLTSNLEALKAYTGAGIFMSQWLPSQAAEQIRRAVDLDPDFAMAQRSLARVAVIRDTQTARGAAARALAISRSRPLPVAHARLIEATVLHLDGREEEASVVLEKAHREAPEDSEVCLELAFSYFLLSRSNEAISTVQEAVRLDPHWADTFQTASQIHAEAGDLPRALQAIDQYKALVPPNNWNAVVTRGDLLVANEHYDEGLDQYRRAEQLQSHGMLRRLLILLGRLEEAEALLMSVPEERRIWPVLSDLETRKGRLDEAMARMEEAIRRSPFPNGWAQWPRSRHAASFPLEQREPRQVLALADRLSTAWAPGVRGVAHLILGDDAAAQSDFSELRKGVAPVVGDFYAASTESIWRLKAASYLGQSDRVIDLTSKVSRAQRVEYSLDLSRAYLALGRIPDAEAELRWLIRHFLNLGSNPFDFQEFSTLGYLLARFYFAQVLERTGRRSEAREWYRYFLSSFDRSTAKLPQTAEARAALVRL